jgi:CoA:oxalate CoA-transferase
MKGPLSGIKVVDFTEYIAGPYCTMMLADMGADVVKVERPEGDAWRHTAPVAPYESRGFIGVNRGKRSISLDLEREEGRAIAHKLSLEADVVTIAYRPGVAKRLGLDYKTLSRERQAGVRHSVAGRDRDGAVREQA